MHAVSKQGVRLMRLFGDQDTKRIFSYVGPEQEYFLVDREKYLKRPDLMYSGRTLFGAILLRDRKWTTITLEQLSLE